LNDNSNPVVWSDDILLSCSYSMLLCNIFIAAFPPP
jgi:hypothetical protein